jgi:hypothetical protein
MAANKEHMFVHEATLRLLRHFKCLKRFTVDKLAAHINWLVPWLSLKRDVLAADQVDLKRI